MSVLRDEGKNQFCELSYYLALRQIFFSALKWQQVNQTRSCCATGRLKTVCRCKLVLRRAHQLKFPFESVSGQVRS